MTNFLTNPTRLSRFWKNSIEKMRIFPLAKYNRIVEVRKLFFSQSTAILFKDSCGSDKRKCRESSSLSENNPCGTRTSNVAGNACGSVSSSMKHLPGSREKCLEDISKISNPDPCDPNSRKLPISKSPWDDPCPRDCKLSSSFDCSDMSSGQKKCPPPPPIGCPPSEEDAKKLKFWRILTLFGALPVVLIARSIIISRAEEESKQPRPKYVPMEYMYRRTKPFPWGDGNHTLFHNPVKNAVPPHGYEVDDPYETKNN